VKLSSYVKRLEGYSRSKLLELATENFNRFIRERDEGKPCISCGNWRRLEAGHYHSAGKHQSVRFNEDNVHGQCHQCNTHGHGELINYAKGLERKIGPVRLSALQLKVDMEKQNSSHKLSRWTLIEIIIRYKYRDTTWDYESFHNARARQCSKDKQ